MPRVVRIDPQTGCGPALSPRFARVPTRLDPGATARANRRHGGQAVGWQEEGGTQPWQRVRLAFRAVQVFSGIRIQRLTFATHAVPWESSILRI